MSHFIEYRRQHLGRSTHHILLLRITFLVMTMIPYIATAQTTLSVAEAGAVGDGKTINTEAIQGAIDRLATGGGGTLVVPKGAFVSGALDLRPGVSLHLEKDAVLRATTDMAHFPQRRTRIEGQFPEFTPALINADKCDGLRITGEGTLDGDGRKIWDEFWMRHRADEKTRNLDVARARLALISNSRNVLVEGVTFKDSQFWNLHFYKCRNVVVRNARFTVPDDYKQAPSTDGIDVDSSQDMLIEGCYFSVTDDAVAMKGTKGPLALEDKDSPPVERVRVTGCTFRRAHAALTMGSEATIVRDVVLEKSQVTGAMSVVNLKLRPDTPQTYENIRASDLVLDNSGGSLVSILPWKQYFDLKGQALPRSTVRNISIANIRGRYGRLGQIRGNPGQTTISDIVLRDVDVTLKDPKLESHAVSGLVFENVVVNGEPVSAPAAP